MLRVLVEEELGRRRDFCIRRSEGSSCKICFLQINRRFSAIPIKAAANFLYSLCIKVQKPEELKQFWKKNEVGVIILLYFKTSFIATIIKALY